MNELSLRVPNEVHIRKKKKKKNKKPKTRSTLDPHSGEGPERKKILCHLIQSCIITK